VDPIAPTSPVEQLLGQNAATRYHQTTSDDFFREAASTIGSTGIDVAFIDGLHTYAQSLADVEHGLEYVNPGGVILMHDCSPQSEEMATEVSSPAEAARRGRESFWTGDVWKTILFLRSTRNDLVVNVLDCDFGIGVSLPGRPDNLVPCSPEEIRQFTYRDFEENRCLFLGLVQPQELFGRLRARTTEPHF
jgi:hypothetical protein